MAELILFVMKTTTFGVDPQKFIRFGEDLKLLFIFCLSKKTNQKKTPVPFDPSGNLCSSGVAENLRFEEQIFYRQPPAVLRQTTMGEML